MGLIELCEKYFQTKNLYDVLQIPENASEKEVKKAYHKMSLQVHPDRVEEDQKLEATEKFKVLGSIHTILSDTNRRALYDETKCVDDEDYNDIVDRDWSVYWRILFKKITDEDIIAYEKEYVGSDVERQDIKQAYLTGKGDMDHIMDHVQFARADQESRIRDIISEMIENKEIPAYKLFTNEPAKKRNKRIAKGKREAKEAEKLGAQETDSNSLENMILQKQASRASEMNSFFDALEAKYGGKKNQKAHKRKATTKTDTVTKNKRRK